MQTKLQTFCIAEIVFYYLQKVCAIKTKLDFFQSIKIFRIFSSIHHFILLFSILIIHSSTTIHYMSAVGKFKSVLFTICTTLLMCCGIRRIKTANYFSFRSVITQLKINVDYVKTSQRL